MNPRLPVEQGQQTLEIAGDQRFAFHKSHGAVKESMGSGTGSAGELGTYRDHWMPLICGTSMTVTSAPAHTCF